jgi:hypothetical protein
VRRVYVSGPMSGYPGHNFAMFNAEAARLRALGYEVVNPVDVNPDPGKPWEDCLRADLAAMLGCDTIAMLPGHLNSRGATLELSVARSLGFKIRYAAEITEPCSSVATNCAS